MFRCFASLLLFFGLIGLQGCATLGEIEPPSVSLADISLQGATLLEQRYILQLRIQNPNTVELPIEGLSYELEINGQPFAKGVSNRSVTVPRYGSELMEVEGTSTLFDVLRQVSELQKGQTKAVQYRLTGKLGVGGGRRVPFEYKGQVALPE